MTARSALRGSVAGAVVAVLATASAARAQPFGPSRSGPGAPIPNVENGPETGPEPKLSSRSVKLFDQRRATLGYQLDIGPIWFHKATETTPGEDRQNFERGTGEIALSTTITTPKGPFYLTGFPKTLFRAIDSKSFAWSIFAQDMAGGVRIGPFEPFVGIGLSVLTVDVFHADWSVEMFSPRVAAGFGLKLGKIRLDIKAHSEYLWRWFGPDYLIRGITLGLRLDRPRPKSPFVEPSR